MLPRPPSTAPWIPRPGPRKPVRCAPEHPARVRPGRRAVSAPPVRPGPRPVPPPRLDTPGVLGRIGGAGRQIDIPGVGSGTLVMVPAAAGLRLARYSPHRRRGPVVAGDAIAPPLSSTTLPGWRGPGNGGGLDAPAAEATVAVRAPHLSRNRAPASCPPGEPLQHPAPGQYRGAGYRVAPDPGGTASHGQVGPRCVSDARIIQRGQRPRASDTGTAWVRRAGRLAVSRPVRLPACRR